MARRAYLDDEGRLQIRLQTNPSQSSHSHEVLHEYRRPAVSGAEDDVRWSAKPIAMERRVGDDHGLGKRPCPQGRLGSERPTTRRTSTSWTPKGQWTMTKEKSAAATAGAPPGREALRPEVKETFPRDDILAIPKFLAEAKPSERKMILGWIVDTRRFVVALPHDKHMSWTQAVDRMLTHRHAFTLYGNYTRPASVQAGREGETDQTPTGRPDSVEGFPSEGVARYLDQQAGLPVADAHSEGGRMPTRHRRLLPQERPGVAISATRAPAGASDPKHSEFLAAFVGMIVEFHGGRVDGRRRSAQSGDSTSAAGWLAKSNFNDDCPLHLTIARAFADFCLTHEIDHYTQWFPGKRTRTSGSSLCGQPLFRRLRLAAAAAQNAALADSTRAKRDSSWRCYERFLGRIDGVGRSLSPRTRTKRKQKRSPASPPPFDGRLRSRQPQEAGNGPLSGSIRATLDGVAQAFRLNKFESPIHDAAGRLDPFWLYN
ncbi:hypothetical protein MHU86_23390 [Fragilaria crotonensis]|nr:hypothetical protein MHU86_23390 [Fragilaria crotonensis]